MESVEFKVEDVTVGLFAKYAGFYGEIIAINEETRGSRAARIAIAAEHRGEKYIHCTTLFTGRQEHRPLTRDEVTSMWDEITVIFASDLESKVHSKFGTLTEVAEALLACEVTHNGSTMVTRFISENVSPSNHITAHEASIYAPMKEDNGLISLVRSTKDAKRYRRTTMKPGRAFRHMLSNLSDAELASLTEQWVEMTSPRDLFLHVGKDAKSFKRAYDDERAAYRNPITTLHRKSIATSCMQGVGRDYYNEDREREYASVGEAYASGDFAVAYLTDKDGLIAGRVVYSDAPDTPHKHGPVYGACEQSLDMLEAHLDNIGSELDVEAWAGLRLTSIGDADDPVVPYIDGELYCTPGSSKYLRLESYGTHGFEGTDGYLTGGMFCECCGDSVNEDEAYMTEDGYHCEVCFDNHFVMTDHGDVLCRDDAIFVHTKSARWGINQEWVHHDEAVYCELIDEYWHVDDVVPSSSGCFYLPEHMTDQFPALFGNEEEEAA